MKAWEVREGNLGWHDVPPIRPSAGETLIRVSHAGICGSDRPKLLHPHNFDLPEPWRPGHEIVGVDTAGRRVVIDPLLPCGACVRCTAGDTHLCPVLRRIGWDLPGGFAEQVVVPAPNVCRLHDSLSPLYATLADPAAVAIHGLRCNPLGHPARLAVIGAGAIGLLSALYAVHQGWEVTIVHRERRPPHVNIAEAVPASFHSVSTLPDGNAFDVVVDTATGADSAALVAALRLVRAGGTVLVQNAYHPAVRLSTPLRDVFRRSVRLIGSFSYCRRSRPDDFALALELLREDANAVASLVSESGALTDLPAIIANRPKRTVREVLTT